MNLSEFRPLHERFRKGLRWLSLAERSPIDRDDFRQKVEIPMDTAWMELTNEERSEYLRETEKRGI